MAVRCFPVFKIVILVVVLGRIKVGGMSKFCNYLVAFVFKDGYYFFSYLFLFIIQIKYLRPVLIAHVRAWSPSWVGS